MNNMLNYIPDDMNEVETKLYWMKAHGYPDITAQEVLEKGIIDGTQYMLDEALDDSYWTALWKENDKQILVRGALGEEVGIITPREKHTTFSEDFKESAPFTWENIAQQIAKFVGGN